MSRKLKPTHITVRRQILVDAPQETVWKILTDMLHWEDWHPDVSRVKQLGPLTVGTRFRWRHMGAAISSEIRAWLPPWRFGWSSETRALRAAHDWRIYRQTNGLVRVLSMEDVVGWTVRHFPERMEKKVGAALDLWLALIKSNAEKQARAAGIPPVGKLGHSDIIPEEQPEETPGEEVTAEETAEQEHAVSSPGQE